MCKHHIGVAFPMHNHVDGRQSVPLIVIANY